MKNWLRFRNHHAGMLVAAVAACIAVAPNDARAEVIWDWSFGGTEAGTFTTNGTSADTAGSFNFSVTNFTVTASTVSALVGRPYTEFQPVQGFLWNGTDPTQFYRNSGSLTNGSNFYVTDPGSNVYGYLFFADPTTSLGRLTDPNQTAVVNFSAVTLAPAAVPEPVTGLTALAGVLGGGAILLRRRRA